MNERKNENTNIVWDRFIRFFHWSLVILFITSYVSSESESIIHIYSGYSILTLVILRILWGFFGSRYARFSSFLYSPRETVRYIRSMKTSDPVDYNGHNPLGALMVFTMLGLFLIITFSGLRLYQIEKNAGPLALLSPQNPFSESNVSHDNDHGRDEYEEHDHDEDGGHDDDEEEDEEEEFWEEIHETAVNLMILFILLHVGGVYMSSKLHRVNLVKAMITGKKPDKSVHSKT